MRKNDVDLGLVDGGVWLWVFDGSRYAVSEAVKLLIDVGSVVRSSRRTGSRHANI